jgi:hypothetical protein
MVVCKYYHSPKVFLLIMILTLIFYQKNTGGVNHRVDNFEGILVNVSKFIIVTGILGVIVVRILFFIFPEVN